MVHLLFFHLKRRLRDQRGVTMLEAVSSAAIVSIGMVAAVRTFSSSKNTYKDIRIDRAVAQIEQELRVGTFLDAEKYLDCYEGGRYDARFPNYATGSNQCHVDCNANIPYGSSGVTTRAFQLTHTSLVSGLSLDLFDVNEQTNLSNKNGWPQMTQSGTALQLQPVAKGTPFGEILFECRRWPTLYQNNINSVKTLNENDAYLALNASHLLFCVDVPSATASGQPNDNISEMSTVLAMVQFTPLNVVTGQSLECNGSGAANYQTALAANQRIGVMNYTIAWQGKDASGPVYGSKSATFVSGIDEN